jgi:hypothetical protein
MAPGIVLNESPETIRTGQMGQAPLPEKIATMGEILMAHWWIDLRQPAFYVVIMTSMT